jgi:hypothetical protein
MATAWEPLFWTEPERFVKTLFNQDDEARFREYKDVRDVLFGEVMRYGCVYGRDEWISPLRSLYDDLVGLGMPAELRSEVLEHVSSAVKHTKTYTVNAFLPFIWQDPNLGVVASAAIDFASLAPLLDDDPMTAPKELIRVIESGEPRNAGAIFGGLLGLGDPRVCKLLWSLKEQLLPEEANEAVRFATGFVSAATIDFVLSWMEGLPGTADDALFGSLAANLGLQRQRMIDSVVMTGLRPFPVTSVTEEEHQALSRLIPLEEYKAIIAPRMIALARAEPEPKQLPAILEMWEIAVPALNC